jgi:hypothetical protein
MKKAISLIIICSSWFPFICKAQVSSEVIKTYPAYITSQVYQVVSKINISADKQIKLAQHFKKQDELAAIEAKNGRPAADIAEYYSTTTEGLRTILSAQEVGAYVIWNSNSNSPFYVALQNITQLVLTEAQIDNILASLDKLSVLQLNPQFTFSKIRESTALEHILNKDQYQRYLILDRQKGALTNSQNDWLRLKAAGLVNVTDSIKINTENYNYELDKIILVDKATTTGSFTEIDKAKVLADVNRPFLLRKEDALAERFGGTKIADVFKVYKTLELTDKQIDDLVNALIELGKRNANYRKDHASGNYDSRAFQAEVLSRTLNKEQYDLFWFLRNKDTANSIVEEDIRNLKKYNLLDRVNLPDVQKELFDYQIQLLIISDLIGIDITNSDTNNMIRDEIRASKPKILLGLETSLEKAKF